MEDKTIESLEVLDWLKQKYGEKIKRPFISISINQDGKDVWLKLVSKKSTSMGDVSTTELINMDVCADIGDAPHLAGTQCDDFIDLGCTFSAKNPIEENAVKLFTDASTIGNVTPIFEK